MRYNEIVVEMAVPTEQIRSMTFYHGTSSTPAAETILAHGLMPPDKPQGRSQLAPVAGRLYITPHINYALIYALGGDIAGHDDPRVARMTDFYGYIFVVPGDRVVNDIQPDEDQVGESIMFAHEILVKKARNAEYYEKDKIFNAMMKPENATWVSNWHWWAKNNLSENQYRQITFGMYAYFAAGGKKLLKKMDSAQKFKLIDMGAHISYLGPLQPEQCWRVDKRRGAEFKRDGSNVFQIAERIL